MLRGPHARGGAGRASLLALLWRKGLSTVIAEGTRSHHVVRLPPAALALKVCDAWSIAAAIWLAAVWYLAAAGYLTTLRLARKPQCSLSRTKGLTQRYPTRERLLIPYVLRRWLSSG